LLVAPKKVNSRRPLEQEPGVDYENDSDEEWESEGEDGDECLSDENESDQETEGEEEADEEGTVCAVI
jgi:hypothetical protein